MLWFEPGHYVRIRELEDGPMPRPLNSGFNDRTAYRVLGMYNPSETSENFLILSNDRDEIWHISNRHVRLQPFKPGRTELRFSLSEARLEIPEPAAAPVNGNIQSTLYRAATR